MAAHPFTQFVVSLGAWPDFGFGDADALVTLTVAGVLLALVVEGWRKGYLGNDAMIDPDATDAADAPPRRAPARLRRST